MIADKKLSAVFDEVAKRVRKSVTQPRSSIIRESRQRLSVNARDVAAIHVIAAARLCEGKPGLSLSILQKEASALQGNATGHRLAGYAHLIQEEMQTAAEHFDHAVRIDPCQHDCWAMLGDIHEKSGEHDRAISYYQRAIVFEDHHHESALALCRLLDARKDLKEAIHTLRVSLFRDQRSAPLNLALAKLLEKRGAVLRRSRNWTAERKALLEAARCYEIVLASAPTAAVSLAYGGLCKRLDQHDESRQAFQRAVELKPDCPAAWSNLAGSLVDSGELDQAIVAFEKSLELAPDHAGTHFRYARARRFKPSEESSQYAQKLIRMADDSQRPARDRVSLHFAAAKVLEDLGEFQQSWCHYDSGNRLKPSHGDRTGKRAHPLRDTVDNATRVFSREFFARGRGSGNPSGMPIFIVGMPRSGTTLTEQILCSHSAIAGAGELKQIERIRQQISNEAPPSIGPVVTRTRQSNNAHRSPNVPYPDVMNTVHGGRIRELADQHLRFLDAIGKGASHVTDKMPTNFIHLGLIATLFPQATVIHCRRNPMDVLVSCYCQNLTAPFCDLEALVGYHQQYRRLMSHWKQSLPLKIHTVDYESLVADPEPIVRGMIDHCGLPWEESCLSFHTNRRAVHTPSKWQVRQPMYSSSVQKWKRFEAQLQDIHAKIESQLQRESDITAGVH